MPRIYPQNFYVTEQLVHQTKTLNDDFENNQINTLLQPSHYFETGSQQNFKTISNRLYQFHNPQLLVYEFGTKHEKYKGVLCCLNASDFKKGNITKHEKVYPKKVLEIQKQLQNTSIKKEPIVVTFENTETIDNLILNSIDKKPDFSATKGQEEHHYWLLDGKTTTQLQATFSNTNHFHLVDGHHRTTAIEHLKLKKSTSKNLFCFLIGLDQIDLKSFVWHIKTVLSKNQRNRLHNILGCFNAIETQNTVLPTEEFPLICCLKNKYYTIQKDAISNPIIPRFIENEILNKLHPSEHWVREYIPHTDVHSATMNVNNYSMSFLMQPLKSDQLIDIAIKNELLPQKSTYALPKLTQNFIFSPF